MILADTSAWVEYDRATGSTVDLRLRDLIAAGGPVAVTEPVIMEVLAGARSDAREADLRRLLLRFHLYQFDPAADFEGAARIYRRCRQAGITPRGLVDCMIAAVARRHEATLLACDMDLDRVARVIGVELDRPATPERPLPSRVTSISTLVMIPRSEPSDSTESSSERSHRSPDGGSAPAGTVNACRGPNSTGPVIASRR